MAALAPLLEKQWKSRNVECQTTFYVNGSLICTIIQDTMCNRILDTNWYNTLLLLHATAVFWITRTKQKQNENSVFAYPHVDSSLNDLLFSVEPKKKQCRIFFISPAVLRRRKS